MDIALFSPSSLFAGDDDSTLEEQTVGTHQSYEERSHEFPGLDLLIREFSFHQLNANLLWPGTFAFAEWLLQHCSWLEGRRIIELGSGTGALAIFLRKSFAVDITTSDFDDEEVEENIAHNCRVNGITPVLPHIRHTWGDTFPKTEPDWDLVIASDILLCLSQGDIQILGYMRNLWNMMGWGKLGAFRSLSYPVNTNIRWRPSDVPLLDVKQYPNLIQTLSFLLKSYKPKDEKAGIDLALPRPAFLMSWRRRIGKEDEELFFSGCEHAGLVAEHVGSRVYCISPRQTSQVVK